MLDEEEIVKIVSTEIKKLQADGLVPTDLTVNQDTILLGMGNSIDSIAFVTLISDIEQRIEEITGQEFVFILQDLHNLNQGKVELLVKDLISYIIKTSHTPSSL